MTMSEDFQNIPWLRNRTRLERILCFAAALSVLSVAVVTVILAYYAYHYKIILDSKERLSNVCLTPECTKAASMILSNMDENVDPCNDFYRFACGEWLKTHTIPDDKSSLDVLDAVIKRVQLKLKNFLEGELNDTEPTFIRMAKILYGTCMDTKNIEKEGMKPLKNLLKNMGGWPVVEGRRWRERKFDWIETLITLRKLGLGNGLIDLSVAVDAKNTSCNILYLDEPPFGISDRTYLIRGLNDSVTAAYYKKMIKAAILLGANESLAKNELLEALEFEMILANYSVSHEESRNVSKFSNKYTVKSLQEIAPQIPWLKYINGLLVVYEINENETLNVAVPDYVKKIAELIASTDKRVIANYILWRAVNQCLSFLSEELRNLNFEFSKVLTGTIKEPPRWEGCQSSSLRAALSSHYIRHHFKAKTKEEVSEIVKYVNKEFLRILDETDWMDEKTKSHAKAKANNIMFVIGYPEELLNDTAVMEYFQNIYTVVEKTLRPPSNLFGFAFKNENLFLTVTNDSYFENTLRVYKWYIDDHYSSLRKPNERMDWTKYDDVAVVNAFYYSLENTIVLPAGYLQSPFFSNDRPNYLNFGSLGSMIGHEITHGLDDTGRQFDKDGNIVNWWAEVTDQNFRKKAQCIIDQYSNYTAENGMNLNGVITQGENIADNGGVKQSYWAYQSWVKDNGPEQLLPGLKYNQNQLFWISRANIFCSKYRPEELNDIIISSYHGIDEFRVIGPISNLEEFSKDFNCPPDSPMSRKHKCQVW